MADIPNWASSVLRPGGLEKIEGAVRQAEKRTSAEIVPMLVRRSTAIGHVPALLACILLGVAWVLAPHQWLLRLPGPGWIWLAVDVFLAVALAVFLARFHVIQRALTSVDDREAHVEQRAELEFHRQGMTGTKGKTGVLVFVSLMERRAVVLADKAIADQLPRETWDQVCGLIIAGVKGGDLAEGMAQAVAACEDLLAPLFPIQPDDVNELKDALIVRE